eukprot:129744-Rhodomonas_salina.2
MVAGEPGKSFFAIDKTAPPDISRLYAPGTTDAPTRAPIPNKLEKAPRFDAADIERPREVAVPCASVKDPRMSTESSRVWTESGTARPSTDFVPATSVEHSRNTSRESTKAQRSMPPGEKLAAAPPTSNPSGKAQERLQGSERTTPAQDKTQPSRAAQAEAQVSAPTPAPAMPAQEARPATKKNTVAPETRSLPPAASVSTSKAPDQPESDSKSQGHVVSKKDGDGSSQQPPSAPADSSKTEQGHKKEAASTHPPVKTRAPVDTSPEAVERSLVKAKDLIRRLAAASSRSNSIRADSPLGLSFDSQENAGPAQPEAAADLPTRSVKESVPRDEMQSIDLKGPSTDAAPPPSAFTDAVSDYDIAEAMVRHGL